MSFFIKLYINFFFSIALINTFEVYMNKIITNQCIICAYV